MISFVWPNSMSYTPWAGGVEIYTISQVEELRRRHIPVRIIACNEMVAESFRRYSDIPLYVLENEDMLCELDDTLIFVMQPMRVSTKHQAYVILHTPIKGPLKDRSEAFLNNGMGTILERGAEHVIAAKRRVSGC